MKMLSLNTQEAYRPELKSFLQQTLETGLYDFILLQEVTGTVLKFLEPLHTYSLLNLFDDEIRDQSHLCILYRSSFSLRDSKLHSVGSMHPSKKFRSSAFGLLIGTFEVYGKAIHIGTLHLHPSLRYDVRAKELLFLKEKLLTLREADIPLIFGGDFNLGYPGEVNNAYRILAPEFIPLTQTLGPTLDSRYTESHHNIVNRTAAALARIGISVTLRADQLFMDARMTDGRNYSVKLLSDRVSDHSAVELETSLF
jgi:endonuclease/exonuclease/phosphatase family metal-dependent hydrolase